MKLSTSGSVSLHRVNQRQESQIQLVLRLWNIKFGFEMAWGVHLIAHLHLGVGTLTIVVYEGV